MKENRVERDLATLGARREARLKVGSLGVNLATDATGTLQAAQEPAHTGDVTNSAGSLALAIGAGKVLLSMLANMATGSVFYRKTAGTGAPEVQTLATLKADLGLTGTNSGDQTSIAGITGTKAEFNTAVSDGDVVFLDSVDTITGAKTFTGAVVATAANLQIKDAGDQTKIVQIDASSVASGTTRTATMPNASGTLVLNSNTQTLSGKSLTNPKITTSTVAGLPAAATAGASAMGWVTDSTVAFTGANIGATVVGGGANAVPVRSTGAAWIIG